MKKVILVLSILLACGYNAVSQNYNFADAENDKMHSFTDGFFHKKQYVKRTNTDEWGTMPLLPKTHGYHYDYPAHETPVGSGLLLLAGMGLGYAIRKRKTEN